MPKSAIILLFCMVCFGCNAEHGTPYWLNRNGGPAAQLHWRNSKGGMTVRYAPTPEDIEKTIQEMDWDDPENSSYVSVTLGQRICWFSGATSSETRPLQIAYKRTSSANKTHVAKVGSVDNAISVLVWFCEEDDRWLDAVAWDTPPVKGK